MMAASGSSPDFAYSKTIPGVRTDAAGNVIDYDIAEEARSVFRNVRFILEDAGSAWENIVDVTVFLTDVADRPRINPVREDVFGEARPASTLIEVAALAVAGAKIEVEAVAAVR